MRPLNRPMFRYGGPIKEGVMSGIREPKKNGGKMLLVGQHPKEFRDASGREQHWAPLGIWGANILRTAAWPFARKGIQQAAKKFAGPMKRWYEPAGYTRNVAENVWKPTKLGSWFAKDPLVKAGMTGAGWTGKGLKKAGQLAKWGVTTPSGLAMTLPGGFFYAKGKWWDKNNNPADPNDIAAAKASTGGPPGGGDPGMQGTGEWFKEQAEKEALAKEQKEWNNRIKKYRDIMDIKGMNKQAAYKSLVDASKLIQESQDFKGDIKSGKLINQVIQAASKQFDKPKATSDAINTLILQNELKKDLNKEENALANLLKQKQIQVADKTLKGDSTAEVIQAIALRTGMPTSDQLNQLISINNPELNLKTIPIKDMGQKDPITYIAEIVSSVNNDPKTPNYPAGNYVIKDKVVQITEDGTITPIPINALK